MNTLKEQLSSSGTNSISPTKSINGIAPSALASPSSDNGANSLSSNKLLNNNKNETVDDTKNMDNERERDQQININNSGRSTPVAFSDKDGGGELAAAVATATATTTTTVNNSNNNINNNNTDGHSRILNEEIAAKDKEVSDGFLLILIIFSDFIKKIK